MDPGFVLAALALTAAGGIMLGFAVARPLTLRGLLIGADRADRTPHCLGGQSYYVMPEKEYCRLRVLDCQSENDRHDDRSAGQNGFLRLP